MTWLEDVTLLLQGAQLGRHMALSLMKLLCKQKGLLLVTMSETIASSVREQMEPLLALLKQAQDQSEAVAKRCQELEVRQSEMHEKTNKLSSDLSGVPGENPIPRGAPLKRSSAINTDDEQGPPIPTENAAPSQLKELRRERRRRELEAITFGR